MSKEKVNITETFELLLNKSIEANKVFLKEGTRIFKEFTGKEKNIDKLNIFRLEGMNDIFNEYVNLNVRHFNNLIDLSMNFMKSVGREEQERDWKEEDEKEEDPSFVLEGNTEPGGVVTFQFLLDNSRPDQVQCQLVSSGFVHQSDNTSFIFKTEFSPQSFVLEKDESKPVSIKVSVPAETPLGLYISKVQVKGFEPAYFSIQLTIVEKHHDPKVNAGKKATGK